MNCELQGSTSIRTYSFYLELRGQESNLQTRDSKSGISTNRNYPAVLNGPRSKHETATVRSAVLFNVSASFPRLKSALRESNPPRQVGSLEPLPLSQGHMLFHEAEAVGLEPTTDNSPAPAFEEGSSSSRMTSLSCGGRNRTCVKTVNSRPPVPARAPPHQTERLDRSPISVDM